MTQNASVMTSIDRDTQRSFVNHEFQQAYLKTALIEKVVCENSHEYLSGFTNVLCLSSNLLNFHHEIMQGKFIDVHLCICVDSVTTHNMQSYILVVIPSNTNFRDSNNITKCN